jgi:hypothetical protein
MRLVQGFVLSAGLSGLFLFGCAEERKVIVQDTDRTSEVYNMPGTSIEAVKAYEFEQRDLAVNNLQQVLGDLNKRILDMRAKSKGVASDSRNDWNDHLTELEKNRDELEVIVTRMKFATHDKWDEVQDSAIENLEEVQDHLQKLQEIAKD